MYNSQYYYKRESVMLNELRNTLIQTNSKIGNMLSEISVKSAKLLIRS